MKEARRLLNTNMLKISGILTLIILITISSEIQTTRSSSDFQFSNSARFDPIILINGNDDLAAFASAGNGSNSNPYIIENYYIEINSETGVSVSNTNKHFILRNISVVGRGRGQGFSFDNTNFGQIENSLAKNTSLGFYLESSCYNTLSNNTAINNTASGFRLHYSSKNNLLTNNSAINNRLFGFYLYSSSKYNSLINNSAINNKGGFVVDSASNNTLANNIASHNSGRGFLLNSAYNNTLRHNTAVNNNFNGYVLLYTRYSLLLNNIAIANYRHGFVLDSSVHNSLTNNQAITNEETGFLLEESGNRNTLKNNTALHNLDGFILRHSNYNILSYNNVTDNIHYGIGLYSSSNNILSNNFAAENTLGDFYFDNSSYYNTFDNNDGMIISGENFFPSQPPESSEPLSTAPLNPFLPLMFAVFLSEIFLIGFLVLFIKRKKNKFKSSDSSIVDVKDQKRE